MGRGYKGTCEDKAEKVPKLNQALGVQRTLVRQDGDLKLALEEEPEIKRGKKPGKIRREWLAKRARLYQASSVPETVFL